MATFVALLRAVNVGGATALPMADLRSLCEGLGLAEVRTWIQSGNVVFRSSWSEARVEAAIESTVSAEMGKRVDVFVRSARAMTEIAGANPFPSAPGRRVAVHFLRMGPAEALLAAIAIPSREEIRPAGRELYVHYPDGMGRSRLNLASLGAMTARNINTVAKLAAMANERRS